MRVVTHMQILAKSQVKQVAALLTISFFDNPMFIYLFPDEMKRSKILKPIFEGIVKLNRNKGTIYTTSDRLEGVLALIKEDRNVTAKGDYLLYVKTLVPFLKSLPHISILDAYKRYKNTDNIYIGQKSLLRKIDSYYSIQMVAVHPKCRGKGYMSQLMRNILAYIDSEDAVCLLETETLENVKMYRHFGFQVIGKMTYVPSIWEQYFLIYDPKGKVLPNGVSLFDKELFTEHDNLQAIV